MQVQATLLFAVAAIAYALPADHPHRPTTALPPAAGEHAHNSAHHAYEATAEGAQAALDAARPAGAVVAESSKYTYGKAGAGVRNVGSNIAGLTSYITYPLAATSVKAHNWLVSASERQEAIAQQNRAYSQQASANLKATGADVVDGLHNTANSAVDATVDAAHRATEKVKDLTNRASTSIQRNTQVAREEAKAKSNAAVEEAQIEAEESRKAADESLAKADEQVVTTGQGIVQNVKDAGNSLAAKLHRGNAKVARKTAESAEAVRESADQTADNEEARAHIAVKAETGSASGLPLASAAVVAVLSAATLLL